MYVCILGHSLAHSFSFRLIIPVLLRLPLRDERLTLHLYYSLVRSFRQEESEVFRKTFPVNRWLSGRPIVSRRTSQSQGNLFLQYRQYLYDDT